ncbi:MAG: hypothetical protein R3C68_13125, partial [Myxococcota bacterium]
VHPTQVGIATVESASPFREAGDDAMRVFAVDGSREGLYRAGTTPENKPTWLVGGKVLAFCPGSDDRVWSLMQRDETFRIVAASYLTPAVQVFEPEEALVIAAGESLDLPGAALFSVILEEAVARGAPQATDLMLRAYTTADAATRLQAVRFCHAAEGPTGVALLWLFANDALAAVRAGALEATHKRCVSESAALCADLLALFIDDPDLDIAWDARDALLHYDVGRSLEGADRDYKLDLLSRVLVQIERRGLSSSVAMLTLLMKDVDAQIREMALDMLEYGRP